MQRWLSRPGRTKGRLGGSGQPELGRQRQLLGNAALQAARRARVALRPRSAPTPLQLKTLVLRCAVAQAHLLLVAQRCSIAAPASVHQEAYALTARHAGPITLS